MIDTKLSPAVNWLVSNRCAAAAGNCSYLGAGPCFRRELAVTCSLLVQFASLLLSRFVQLPFPILVIQHRLNVSVHSFHSVSMHSSASLAPEKFDSISLAAIKALTSLTDYESLIDWLQHYLN